MHRLLLEAILEDIFSDLIKKYPEQEVNLNQAKQKGVKPKYFQWIAKILQRTKEPINDIIPVVNAFDAKQRTGHPDQKPLEMIETIIKVSSNPGDLVVDFFCGSGTTLVAAKNTGRNAIGFEIQERWVNITKERLNSVV